jgi:ornithine cyclodeaminase/alanine dehydrogenase-like protein (mu-crystallin family)
MSDILLLRRSDVLAALSWSDLIDTVANALVTRATAPANATSVQVAVPNGSLHLKAGALSRPPVLTVKANIRPDAGSASGVVVLYDTGAFAIRAIMDSRDLTSMRTSAMAAVAVRTLRRPDAKAARMALLGTGPVAQGAMAAIPLVTNVETVRLWSRTRANAEDLALKSKIAASVHDTPAEAAAGADIIVTCTPSRVPLLERADVKSGVIVLAMGADSPGKRELGPGMLEGCQLFVDIADDATQVGETAWALRERTAPAFHEIGDVLAGKAVRSSSPDALKVFDSVGSATVDAAVAALVIERAHALGAGSRFDFSK